MMTLSEAAAWAQIIGTVAITFTFLIYWRQLLAMQAQVSAARDASRTQNLLSLIDYIQRPEHRNARHSLQQVLSKKDFASWSPEDRISAEMACSCWDAVGLVLKNTPIPGATEIITETWRHSIYSCFETARRLTVELREDRDPKFWDEFEWLAQRALDGYVSINGKLRPRHG